MARIDYSDAAASAFQASRELPPDALSEWRATIARHLVPRPALSLAAIAATARREAHTPLMLITDSACEAGLARRPGLSAFWWRSCLAVPGTRLAAGLGA